MEGFSYDDLLQLDIVEVERKMISLYNEYEEIIGRQISLNQINVSKQFLCQLLQKSILTGKDYVYRYTIREIDFDDWIEETLCYISEKQNYIEAEEINRYIINFANEKKLYSRSTDEIFGIVRHLYSMIVDCLSEKKSYDYHTIENQSQIKEFTQKSIERLVEDTVDDLWEPEQLQELYIIYDNVFEIVEKIANENRELTADEKIELDNAIQKVNDLKDEMDLQRSEYRKIEDVEYIWAYISEQLFMDCNFAKTHNKEKLSLRLGTMLSE